MFVTYCHAAEVQNNNNTRMYMRSIGIHYFCMAVAAPPDVTKYQYDKTSGYYYDPTTGLYYEPNTQVSL